MLEWECCPSYPQDQLFALKSAVELGWIGVVEMVINEVDKVTDAALGDFLLKLLATYEREKRLLQCLKKFAYTDQGYQEALEIVRSAGNTQLVEKVERARV